MNNSGLAEADIKAVCEIVCRYPSVDELLIFGSRSMGNFHHGSDVDLAIKGKGIDQRTLSDIADQLNEESHMPYHFDIVHYDSLQSAELIEHINRRGIILYHKPNS